MSLFYNTDNRSKEGMVNIALHTNTGGKVSISSPSKFLSPEGYNFPEFHGSSISDCSSAGSIAVPLSISGRTVGDERMSGKTGPMNPAPARPTYFRQMGQKHRQSIGIQNNQSYAFARQCNRMQPKFYFQPEQMVVPSPGYVNMLPIHVQVPPMMLSQPQSVRTPQVFNNVKQHDGKGSKKWAISPTLQPGIIYPSKFSQVAHLPLFSPLVSQGNASTPFVNYAPSVHNKLHRCVKNPVISHASYTRPCSSEDAPPKESLGTKHLLENTSSERNAFTLSPASVASVQRRIIAPFPESSVPSQSTIQVTHELKTVSDETLVCNTDSLTNGKVRREEGDLWPGSCNYIESELNAGSSLFVSWSGSRSVLVGKLRHFKFEVVHAHRTSDDTVVNVVFESHASARKAFTMQRTIRLRMVPPKKSRFKWLRNPSPKFLVKYELKRILVMKKGKAESHDIVGDLIYNYKEHKGCLVWADQLKGHRIRLVGYKGSLKCVDGEIVDKEGLPNALEGVLEKPHKISSLGWISYRSQYEKEMFVIRRSGNLLSDYIYRG